MVYLLHFPLRGETFGTPYMKILLGKCGSVSLLRVESSRENKYCTAHIFFVFFDHINLLNLSFYTFSQHSTRCTHINLPSVSLPQKTTSPNRLLEGQRNSHRTRTNLYHLLQLDDHFVETVQLGLQRRNKCFYNVGMRRTRNTWQ